LYCAVSSQQEVEESTVHGGRGPRLSDKSLERSGECVWPLSELASADWRPSNVVETKDLMSSASRDETTSEVSGTTRKPSSRDSRTSHGLNFSFHAVIHEGFLRTGAWDIGDLSSG